MADEQTPAVNFEVPDAPLTTPQVPPSGTNQKNSSANYNVSWEKTQSEEMSWRSASHPGLSPQSSEKVPLMMSSRDLSVGINPGLGHRHLVTFMCFLGCAVNYALRVNLSVAIVAMVKHEEDDTVLNVTFENQCKADPADAARRNQEGEFNWDANTQGIILGAFFYGALMTQLLGGILAEKFGGTHVFCFGIFLTSVFTILTPPLVRTNVTLLVIARVLEGLGEGMTVPAMYVILSKWSPRLERTQFGAFAMAGCNVGNVLGLALTGILSGNEAGGWPLAFYTFGGLGLVWVIAWFLFVYESPSSHPRISISERNYILISTGERSKSPDIPWRAMLTSPALWAITAAHFSKNWVYFTLLTTLPSYMRQVLKFDVSKNGVLSSVPYLTMWFVEIVGSQLLDFLRRRKLISTTLARKLFNTIGVILTVIFLVVEGYVGCNKYLAVTILSLSTAFLGLTSCGFQVNHLDIAPVFAGTLMGITNNVATIPGIVAPSVVTAITEAKPFPSRWRIVFFISALVHLGGGLLFALFSSGKEQPWAKQKKAIMTEEKQQDTSKDAKPATYGSSLVG